MQYMLNSMIVYVSTFGENVWFVDSSALNHMTHRGEWFKEMQTIEKPIFVEIGDNTTHVIAHTGIVALTMHDGKMKYLADVLHVLSITKNLVSIGHMAEEGLQVRFTHVRLFVEEFKEDGRLIAPG